MTTEEDMQKVDAIWELVASGDMDEDLAIAATEYVLFGIDDVQECVD